jgi:glycosyltransferase involved in cell wall biosynthesis
MHIAYVMMSGNRNFSGGVPSVVYERCKLMLANGHRVSVICVGHPDFDQPEITTEGIHLYPYRIQKYRLHKPFEMLGTMSPLFLASMRRGLERAHKEQPIDLIDLQDAPCWLAVQPFSKARGVPYVLTINGTANNPAPRPWTGRKLHLWYERKANRNAALVLPISEFMARFVRAYGVPESKIRVVPAVLDAAKFSHHANRNPSLPLKLLYVGRIDAGKRVDVILEAIRTFGPGQVQLDIVGGGPAQFGVEDAIQRDRLADRVTFHGFVYDRDRVRQFYANADLFVFASQFEAQGLVLLEAIASGLYPISSDIPAAAELLPREHLYPVGDSEALALRIKDLLKDPASIAPRANSLVSLLDRFSPSSVLDKLANAYQQALIQESLP